MPKTNVAKMLDWVLEGLTIVSGVIMVISGTTNIVKNRKNFANEVLGFFKKK